MQYMYLQYCISERHMDKHWLLVIKDLQNSFTLILLVLCLTYRFNIHTVRSD